MNAELFYLKPDRLLWILLKLITYRLHIINPYSKSVIDLCVEISAKQIVLTLQKDHYPSALYNNAYNCNTIIICMPFYIAVCPSEYE